MDNNTVDNMIAEFNRMKAISGQQRQEIQNILSGQSQTPEPSPQPAQPPQPSPHPAPQPSPHPAQPPQPLPHPAPQPSPQPAPQPSPQPQPAQPSPQPQPAQPYLNLYHPTMMTITPQTQKRSVPIQLMSLRRVYLGPPLKTHPFPFNSNRKHFKNTTNVSPSDPIWKMGTRNTDLGFL